MKATTYSAMRGFLFLGILFLLSLTLIDAQVKIKERVEITPNTSILDTVLIRTYQTLDYPSEVHAINPYFRDPSNHASWRVSCNGSIVEIIPSFPDDVDYSKGYVFNVWWGGSYGIFPPLSYLTFDHVYQIGDPPHDIAVPWYMLQNDSFWPDKCGGGFHLYTADDTDPYNLISHGPTQIMIDIIRLNFCPPINIILGTQDSLNIMYGESYEIPVGLLDACNRTISDMGATPVSYHIGITSGQEWGYLYNQMNGQTGDTIDVSADDSWTSFKFLASEQKPTQDQHVVLRAWSDNASYIPGTLQIIVKSSSCMLLSISKPMVHPHEIDTITIMKTTLDGNVIPCPANQILSIWMNTDDRFGTLRCPATGKVGSYLIGPQPFEFIANNNFQVDTLVVEIQASSSTGGGVVASIGIGGKDTLPIFGHNITNKQQKAKKFNAGANEIERKNIELSMKSLQSQLNNVSVKRSDEKQKQKLAIGIEQNKAWLAYETARTPSEKQKAMASMKQAAILAAGESECKATAEIIVKKKELILTAKPLTIFEGDTALLDVKKKLPDSTTESFPADQLIDIWMNTDGSYGKLRSVPTGQEGSGIWAQQQPFQFIAANKIDSDSVSVEVQVWVDDDYDRPIATITIKKKRHIELWSVSDTVYYGDTIDVDIVPCNRDSLFSSLGADQDYRFSVALTGETSKYGKLLYHGASDTLFESVPSVNGKGVDVKFAANGIEPDGTVELTFYLKAIRIGSGIEGSSKKPSPIGLDKNKSSKITSRNLKLNNTMNAGLDEVVLENSAKLGEDKSLSILLGESKYYYATEDNGQLTIHKTTDPTKLPSGGLDDVTFVPVAAQGSEKNPVYWEKKYPEYDGYNSYTGMQPLPSGMIRLIGRYWELGKAFKTILTATRASDSKTASIEIEIKKPNRLLTNGQSTSYQLSRDVFGNQIDIDSICEMYGGKYGISPQLIKGQMQTESAIYNFGGTIGKGFAPSYRYEPYTTQFSEWVIGSTNNPFFVNDENVNNPPIPNHQYVQTIPYMYPNKSVWDVVYDYSQLINDIADPAHRLYGIRTYADTMNFFPYSTIQKIYHAFLNDYMKRVPLKQAAQSANASMITFLKDEWNGNVRNGTKGLSNIKAQTRIASSYGLLQSMYGTAVTRENYPEDILHLPENLNINSNGLNISIQYQEGLLIGVVGASLEYGGNWPNGFEGTVYWYVYKVWNPYKQGYPDAVLFHSQNFIPQP